METIWTMGLKYYLRTTIYSLFKFLFDFQIDLKDKNLRKLFFVCTPPLKSLSNTYLNEIYNIVNILM